MHRFQIIAIKTGANRLAPRNFLKISTHSIEIDFLKNLKTNTIYKFNKNYQFEDDDFSKIEYKSDCNLDLYELRLPNKRVIPINITGVVGQNGSGKSTLVELIYWVNYNLGCLLELLQTKDAEKYEPNVSLDIEILYSTTDGRYHILKVSPNNIITTHEFTLTDNSYCLNKDSIWREIKIMNDIKEFFYSIVINYSMHSLNSKEIGEWINPLFHKNDGYQTPIVLNPMRTNGNILINRERNLLSRRLQSNLLEPILGKEIDSLRNLANGKIATYFEVEYKDSEYEEDEDSNDIHYNKRNPCITIAKDQVETAIVKYFKIPQDIFEGILSSFKDYMINYICHKVEKMVYSYDIYKRFRAKGDSEKVRDIDGLFEFIVDKNSHTTFKIKGAILHLKYNREIYYKLGQLQNHISPTKKSFSIDIEKYSKLVDEIIKNEVDLKVNTFMMTFPSFFRVTIYPQKNGKDLPMNSFSSGEKQKINSISSIVYHLININSVDSNDSEYINYKFVNIILDEIELYYHPEWQRTYISDLLDYLEKINPKNLEKIEGINIIIITHSPFILSDITHKNTIRLSEGRTEDDEPKTLGANIHSLLADDFFMKDGFMGKFATRKIKSAISFIENYKNESENQEWTSKKVRTFIDMIGEPLIKNNMRALYSSKIGEFNNEFIMKEIERLKSLLPKED